MLESGANAVQPAKAPPPCAKTPLKIVKPPKINNQTETAFRRGNAMSGAPICSGIKKLANPKPKGAMTKKIIAVPCKVKI